MTTISDPISATSATASAASVAAKGSASDTEHRFLSLLVAQLKNQDPLNPMDNAEITTQLAQISTVNGIEQLNRSMKSLSTGFEGLQSVQATTLAGRQVMLDGSTLNLDNGQATGGFELDQPADRLAVTIVDAAGALVRSVDLGAQPAGVQTFSWDGKTDNGASAAAGSYIFKLKAVAQDREINAHTLSVGTVRGVTPAANGVGTVLGVGGIGNVALADVKKIL